MVSGTALPFPRREALLLLLVNVGGVSWRDGAWRCRVRAQDFKREMPIASGFRDVRAEVGTSLAVDMKIPHPTYTIERLVRERVGGVCCRGVRAGR
jgi:hypothetical protein